MAPFSRALRKRENHAADPTQKDRPPSLRSITLSIDHSGNFATKGILRPWITSQRGEKPLPLASVTLFWPALPVTAGFTFPVSGLS